LEKIEMKKTLVAVAALAAVAGAQADVSITGAVDYAFTQSKTGDTTTNGMGGDSNQFNNIAFSASEDLGNGLKAQAKIDLGIGYAEGKGAGFTRESWVGLTGSIGDLNLGRQYTPHFLAFTVDPVGLPALSVGQEGMVGTFLTGNARDVRRNNSFTYTTPAFNGIKANVFTAQGGTVADPADPTSTASTYGYTTGYGVSYANGPFSLNYQTMSTDGLMLASPHKDATAGVSSFTTTDTGTGSTNQDVVALSYDFGVAKAAYIYASAGNSAQSGTSHYIGVGVPVNENITLAAGYNSSSYKTDSEVSSAITGQIYRVNYAFSKRTVAYLIYGKDTTATTADNTGRTTSTTTLGLSHSF